MADNGDTQLRPLVHALRTPLTIVEGFADALDDCGLEVTA